MTGGFLVAHVAVAAAVYSIDKPFDYLVPSDRVGDMLIGRRVMVPFGTGNKKTEGFVLSLTTEQQKRPLKYVSHVFTDDVVLSQSEISLAVWMCRRYCCTFFEAANSLLPPGIWNRSPELWSPSDITLEQALSAVGKSKKKAEILTLLHTAEKPMSEPEISAALSLDTASTHLKKLKSDGLINSKQSFSKGASAKTVTVCSLAMPIEQARNQAGTGAVRQKRLDVIECVAQAGTLPEREIAYLTGVSTGVIRRLGTIGILKIEKAEVYRRPPLKKGLSAPQIELNDEQKTAFDGLCKLLDGKPHGALLYGVTASGKTSVYIEIIKKVVAQGKTAIMLVPEIALTPQTVELFYRHFGDTVAVVHSALTHTQRYDEYRRIKNGKATVIIGTRTAVLAPADNVGVIILDEEHEFTYKSETAPRYHARDIAKYRAGKSGALVIMGSATPSIESFYHAKSGRYSLFEIKKRFGDAPLPQAILSNMRDSLKQGDPSPIGSQLYEQLKLNLENQEQSILFINRRGAARMVTCIECGDTPKCENCSVSLIYHSASGRMMCHHCGYSRPMSELCTQCGSHSLKAVGSGTQRIETELCEALPGIRILRMDADTTTGRVSHEKLLDDFSAHKADVLIGTQMVAKGLDFPNVTLVGVLDADISLYCGDHYSQERTFALITQVVGRAGRRQKPGRAIIQTFTPEHPVISAAANQDYDSFYSYELESRRALGAPPFCDIYMFTLSGADENNTLRAAMSLTAILSKLFTSKFSDLTTQILGPVPSALAKINKRYRFNVSLRLPRESARGRELMSAALSAFYNLPHSKKVAISADVNPFV